MAADQQVNIAIVGPGFGAEFIPIYQKHPQANMYAICQRTEAKLHEVGGRGAFGIPVERRYASYVELLAYTSAMAGGERKWLPEFTLSK